MVIDFKIEIEKNVFLGRYPTKTEILANLIDIFNERYDTVVKQSFDDFVKSCNQQSIKRAKTPPIL
jgi:hypothetical protein